MPDTTDAPRDDADPLPTRLTRLADQFESVEGVLEELLLAPIRTRRRPDSRALDLIRDILSEYDAVLSAARTIDPELPDGSAVPEILARVGGRLLGRSWASVLASTTALLTDILRVRLSSGNVSPALDALQARAADLLATLPALPATEGEVQEWSDRVAPFRDFWRLLTDGASLSDEESESLTERVKAAFGGPLVRPAFFRQLVVDTPATAEITVAEADVSVAPPADTVASPGEQSSPVSNPVLEPPTELGTAPTSPTASRVPPAVGSSPPPATPGTGGLRTLVAVENVAPLPQELGTFEAFAEQYWIHPVSGACEQAPWLNDDFEGRVEVALTAAIDAAAGGDLARLADAYLLTAPLVRAERASVTPETLRDLAAVLTDPGKTSVGRDPGRLARLRGDVSGAELQLGLALEAARPTYIDLPYGEELTRLLERAHYRDAALRGVVGGLLRHHTQSDVDPIAQIRASLGKEPPARIDWEEALLERRKRVKEEVKRITLNAGSAYVGGFRHCRLAWSQFMTSTVLPLVPLFYPEHTGGWNAEEMQARIERLHESHAAIADAADAREKSRRIMDRAVERLVQVLSDVNEVYRELGKTASQDHRPAGELVQEARRLVGGPPPGDSFERLAHTALTRVLSPNPPPTSGHPLALGPTFFAVYPSLLTHLPDAIVPLAPPLASQLEGPPRVLAATLLNPLARLGTPVGWDEVEARAREEQRYDRIAALCGALPPGDQGPAAQETNRLMVEAHHRIDRLRRAWRGLEALRVDSHKANLAVINWAASAAAAARDPRLVGAWLDRAADAFERQLASARAAWDVALAAEPDEADRLRALRAGRYDLAVRGPDGATAESRPPRETLWRADAARTYPNPRGTLIDLAPHSPVAEKWTTDLSDRRQRHNTLTSLRSEFTKWVFGKDLLEGAEKGQSRVALETERVRRHLSALQPTYLPQLHAGRRLVVVAAPESPVERDYPRRVVESALEHGENDIVAVLCPGMTPPVREQVRRQLHASNRFAGTVDDLDLCRLLNPGGIQPSPVVGLLEMILEQQPWKARNPYSVPEGSEMRLEMYVGRREEAEQLATTSAKTRLFSGRKLGKTALLQFIRQTQDGRELSNGRRLRVVYVSIVGVDREDLFAKKVLDQLRQDFPNVSLPTALGEPTALLDALQSLLRQRSGEDLLIVLDEADEFVAAQVREDGRRKGTTLSWKLRGDPRVRYVFTGYWATSTRDGVWYNWGDVLELSQLGAEEAAGLIARPLARMGIDAGEQAAEVAFRCGYQPAVLLRFGERLVERMADDGFREGARVTHELVQDTFEDAKVQTEIQGVVRANFQGNPFGQAVFAVVLRESARAPLGHWLRGLDQSAVDAFRQQLGTAAEPDLATTVSAQLRDMHLRKLLLRRLRDGQPEYQLKFPHHLATLLADLDLETEIRTNLRAWRETHAAAGETPASEGRSPLRRSDLATLRDMLRPDMADAVPAVIVVGSPWAASLDHEPGGVPDRLGLPPHAPRASDYDPKAGFRCWRQASPVELEKVLASPPAALPTILLGGIDLLRAAIDRRNRGGSASVEAFGPYRMSDGQFRWWFQRILGVEFPGEHVYLKGHASTAGVPLLVGEFEAILMPGGPPPGGASLGVDRATEAFQGLARRIADPEFAARVGAALTNRERDLLRMSHTVTVVLGDGPTPIGEFLAGGWTESDFGPTWATCFPDRPFPPSYLLVPEDPVAVETLLAAGFLPAADAPGEPISRVRPLPTGDPVVTLLNGFRESP